MSLTSYGLGDIKKQCSLCESLFLHLLNKNHPAITHSFSLALKEEMYIHLLSLTSGYSHPAHWLCLCAQEF